VVGADNQLANNLETFFHLDYPNEAVELIFCVPTACDPSLPIIAELREQYPAPKSWVSIGNANVGVNPKINNIGTSHIPPLIHSHSCGKAKPHAHTRCSLVLDLLKLEG
jgi:hypothetical protein